MVWLTKGEIALAPDGRTATLHGLGAPVTLRRGGEPVPAVDGPFAGLYAAGTPVAGTPAAVWLDLQQAGTGPAGEVRIVELERCTCPCQP